MCVNSLSIHVVLADRWSAPYFATADGFVVRDTKKALELYRLSGVRSTDTKSFFGLMAQHLEELKEEEMLIGKPVKLDLVFCSTEGRGAYRKVEWVVGSHATVMQCYRHGKCGNHQLTNWTLEQLDSLE